jgi:hypothetical protein
VSYQLGGLAKVTFHQFTRPVHNPNASQVSLIGIPNGVDSWNHLRQRRLLITVLSNGWRIGQYLETFSNHFEILKHCCALRKGEILSAPRIEAKLADYGRDELTCGARVIVALMNR